MIGLDAGDGRQPVLITPGLRQSVDLLVLVDGKPRLLRILVDVVGAVCPDPAAHARECDETNYELRGDCDGEVREYLVHSAVAGKAAGETVLLCASHAQQHGRLIRKAAGR